MKNRETDHKQKIHRISDTDEGFVQTNNDHCDHDDSRSVEFNSLNTFPDPKAPHLRPLWFSERHDSSIHLVEAEVDSGAGCNTFPLYLYRKIFGAAPLEPPSVVIKAFGDQPVRNLGCKVLFLHIGKQILQKKFQVCDVRKNPIIGRDLSAEMGYITFPPITEPHLSSRPTIQKIYTISTKAETTENTTDVKRPVVQKQTKNQVTIDGCRHNLPITKDYILKEFNDVFTGMGDLPGGEYNIKMKPFAEPVQHAPRRVPEKRKSAYKAELERLVKEGVITKVNTHTDWVNSVVSVDKPDGSIRLCLDPSDVNEYIERNQYHMKSIDEISAELHGSKFFTLMDAKSGYWQVKLNKRSSFITTFNTPWGKYRFLRLPFGLKVSSDVFQERLDSILNQAKGITGIADDCLVTGSTSQDHDTNLLVLLHLARANNLKFNPKKVQFKTSQCRFFGQMITPDGVQIDPDKVDAIQNMPQPTNKQELESYLGMINYLKRHSYELTRLTRPFVNLMKKHAIFSWESQHESAFQQIKQIIAKAPILCFFDVNAPHIIQTDASSKGLGAVLLQNGKPVVFTGRTLTPAETNYSTLERELTAIVFALHRLHNYIHGGEVTVMTDHKPLVSMFQRPVHLSSVRQQRLLLKIHEYDVTLRYLKGKDNCIADALSRLPIESKQANEVDPDITIPVHAITDTLNASESRIQRVRRATTSDPTMNQLTHYILHGWPPHKHLANSLTHNFWNYKNELSVEDGLIYKGDRLVIPERECKEFLTDLHVGHLGEEKTLLRARQLVFWPNMTEDIRATVRACTTCQTTRPSQQKEPLIPHDVPAKPWEKLGIDFFEWNGIQHLLVADYYSKFPVIRAMTSSTSASRTVSVLKTIFSEYGVPSEVFTDQGPQFTSQEFKDFAAKYEFAVTHSSPRYPQSNGFIEAMVKVVKGVMTRAQDSGTDLTLAMLVYRATPFKSGVASPAELLNQRKFKDLIPIKQRLNTQQDDSREAMLSAKHTSQEYYNSHAKEREQLSELQHVWYKKDPVAHWQRGSVVQIADTPKSYVVQDDSGARYQRNSRHVRSATVPTDSEDPSDATPLVEPDRSKDVPRTFTETGDVITRSGRVSRKTVKYTA